MNALRRDIAPLTDLAWKRVEQDAVHALRANLSNRRIVDVSEPHGFDFSAVNLGKLSPSERTESGVNYGIRRVLPLVEMRVPIELDLWALDDLSRGAADVDTDAVTQAALELSAFEERAVYRGFGPAGIVGLAGAALAQPMELGESVENFSEVVAKAVLELSDHGVEGPFGLVLGSKPYRLLLSSQSTDPPRQQIARLLDGPIHHSSVLEGGFLVSLRGGDFELTLGQDASIGYDWHDKSTVHLYLSETFTFRVIEPRAVVPLSAGGSI